MQVYLHISICTNGYVQVYLHEPPASKTLLLLDTTLVYTCGYKANDLIHVIGKYSIHLYLNMYIVKEITQHKVLKTK